MLRHPPPALAHLTVSEVWRRIEARIEALAPSLLSRFAPPASDAEIEALERELGVTLPPDYVASLREHAGCRTATNRRGEPYPEVVISSFILLPPSLILAEREWLMRNYAGPASPYARIQGPMRRARYDAGWVPVVREDEDRAAYDCIDTVPADGGTHGQIIAMCTNDPDHVVAWSSFRDLLAGLLDRLERSEPDAEALEEDGILVLEP